MPEVHRLADVNIYDGEITDIPQSTVYANGMLISVDGSQVEGGPTTTANGSQTVFINGIPVNRRGDEDSDGTPRAEGSPNVFIGDTVVTANTATGAGAAGGAGADGTPPSPGKNNADGFKSIAPTTLTAASANYSSAIMSALDYSGAIPSVERLPFGGDDSTSTSVDAGELTSTSISDPTLATVQAWYVQKITKATQDAGLTPNWGRLPFGGDDANA